MTWQAGDRVSVRGADWRVVRTTSFDDCEALDLAGERATPALTLLLPFDRPRPPSRSRLQVVSRRRWARAVGTLLRTTYPYGGLRHCPSRIRLLPYQLEPALAMFRYGEPRILIADDVGLGKTVEAGLIVTELFARRPRSRVLILCPASIRTQWTQELATLFSVAVIQADSLWLRHASRELPRDVNPWALPACYLASMDFVKRPEALQALEDLRWDLLIVDEAHGATSNTDRRAALHALAQRSHRVVLLTATPHSGDDGDFVSLCGLGAHAGSAPVALFRRSRADTALNSPPPRTHLLSVRLSDAERRTHRLLEDYTSRVWRESKGRGDTNGLLLATVLRKRALSSPASLHLSLVRRLALLAGTVTAPAQLWLPLGEVDEDDQALREDEAGDAVLGGRGLADEGGERTMLRTICEAAARAVAIESKIRVLQRFLRRAAEPALVFTEYRDTAEHVAGMLTTAGHAVRILHGGLTRRERAAAVGQFTSAGCVLVATDAASEGLNLHHVCRLVVHFELPWAPLRLQQRCGRVNRIGQLRRVHEVALVANDTCEQLVLGPLVLRSAKAAAFGGSPLTGQFREAAVAARVFGDAEPGQEPGTRNRAALTRLLDLREDAREEVTRLELLRRTHGRAPRERPRRRSPIVPLARAKHPRADEHATATILLIVTSRHASGSVFERLPLALRIDSPVGRRARPVELRGRVLELLRLFHPTFDLLAHDFALEQRRLWGAAQAAAVRATTRRAEEMRRHMQSAARQLVQAGLFDRRSAHAPSARRRAVETPIDGLIERPPAPDDAQETTAYEVVAVFVGS